MTSPNLDIQALLRHEPGIRALARDLVGPGARADDLVQDTWMVALRQSSNARDLGSWLRGVVRHLASKSTRREGRRRSWEQASAKEGDHPSSASIFERESLRRELFEAIWSLGEPARTTLLLRYFEGLPPREIARRMCVPVETVRTRTKRALSQVREALTGSRTTDKKRRRMATGLLGLALSGRSPSLLVSSRQVIEGSLAMAAKSKVVIGAVALIALVPLVWMMLSGDGESPTKLAPQSGIEVQGEADEEPAGRPLEVDEEEKLASQPFVEPKQEQAPAAAPASQTGNLRVKVIRTANQAPLANCEVGLTAVSERVYSRRHRWQRTDAQGVTVYTDLKPGRVYLSTIFGGREMVKVEKGKTMDVAIELSPGAIVKGKVVDAKGRGTEGASVFLVDYGFTPRSKQVATTGKDGTFLIGEVSGNSNCRVSARHPGYVPSNETFVDLGAGSIQELTLRLGDLGGRLRGRVLSPDGKPVEGARVHVGNDHQGQGQGSDGRTEETPGPQLLITDHEGRFETLGLDLGSQDLVIKADGFSQLDSKVEIRAGVVSEEEFQLGKGVRVSGRIVDPSGVNAANVMVRAFAGKRSRSVGLGVRTRMDGTYEMVALPPGPLRLEASKDGLGFAKYEFEGNEGDALTWNGELASLPAIRGVVVDSDGNPQSDWTVQASAFAKGRMHFLMGESDEEGRFVIADCRSESYRLSARRHLEGEGAGLLINAQEQDVGVVKAGTQDLRVVVTPKPAPSAWITGKVVMANGDPARAANIVFRPLSANTSQVFDGDGKTGTFKIGPVPPGDYSFSCGAPGHAEVRLVIKGLLRNEARSLGTLSLPLGGRLFVHLLDVPKIEKQGDFYLSVRPLGSGPRRGLPVRGNEVESGPLAAGDYVLEVGGLKIANYRLPFSLTDGGTTHMKLTVRRGVRQQFHPTDIPAEVSAKNLRLRVSDSSGLTVADSSFWSKDKDGNPMRVLGVAPDSEYAVEVYEVGEPEAGRELLRRRFSITGSGTEQYAHRLSLK